MDGMFKDWTIEKCIGKGSFGKVYEIHREDFGHTYKAALKVIKIPQERAEIESAINDGMTEENVTEYFYGMVEKIVEEFALMSKLKGNSTIVSYEDHHVEKNADGFGWTIYIRMELLTPLYQYIKTNTVTVKDIIQLGIDMCQALEICQKYNIIHRDIKPENIFISELGTFKLGDFGIARELEKTSSGLSKVGTKSYMAPEVYKGTEYNSTVDIYSLGIVLYRFLNNNRLPFMPPAPQAIKYSDKEKADIMRMSGQKMPHPCNASGRLAEIVLKACEYNPKDRYDNAREMRRALEAIMYSEVEKAIVYPQGDILENSRAEYVSDSRIAVQGRRTKQANADQLSEPQEGTRYLFAQQKQEEDKSENKAGSECGQIEEKENVVRKQETMPQASVLEKQKKEKIKPPVVSKKKISKVTIPKLKEKVNVSKIKEFWEKSKVIMTEIKKNLVQWIQKHLSDVGNRKKMVVGVGGAVLLVVMCVLLVQFFGNPTRKNEPKATGNHDMVSAEKVTKKPQQEVKITQPPMYAMINTVGKTKSEAIQLIKKQNAAKIEVQEKYSNLVKKGKIISQTPKAGEKFYLSTDTKNYKVLQKVVLTVSKGQKPVMVPDLTGKTLKRAKIILQKKGLKVKVKGYMYSKWIRNGSVVYQSIASGKKVKRGRVILLTISKGEKKIYTPQATAPTQRQTTPRSNNNNNVMVVPDGF